MKLSRFTRLPEDCHVSLKSVSVKGSRELLNTGIFSTRL
jgi:hypothetical protein